MSIISRNAKAFNIDNTSISTDTYTYSTWLKHNTDHLAVLYRVATLTATVLTLTVQGRHDNTYDSIASLCTIQVNAAQDFHELYNITPHFSEIRVGAKIDFTSTPNNLYAGIIRSEVK